MSIAEGRRKTDLDRRAMLAAEEMMSAKEVLTPAMKLKRDGRTYVAWQRVRDKEERDLKRGWDLGFRARNKAGRLIVGSQELKLSKDG